MVHSKSTTKGLLIIISLLLLAGIIVGILFGVGVLQTSCRTGSLNVKWMSGPHPSGKYGDASPGARLKDVIEEFGSPSIIDPRKGGFAIWLKRDLDKTKYGKCFEEIMIRDEQIPHGNPATHVDFLYAWYYLDVPDDLVPAVRDLSKSVTYDPLKKWVRARCHAQQANVATLLLAKKIATRQMTPAQAKAAYGDYVKTAFASKKNYEKMLQELCK